MEPKKNLLYTIINSMTVDDQWEGAAKEYRCAGVKQHRKKQGAVQRQPSYLTRCELDHTRSRLVTASLPVAPQHRILEA